MVIEFKKADVAQRKEQGSSKAKVAGSSPAVSTSMLPSIESLEKFRASTEYESIKASYQRHVDMINRSSDDDIWAAASKALEREKERLAYNAAYQRDLRAIKRLGLNCTVAQYRESLK